MQCAHIPSASFWVIVLQLSHLVTQLEHSQPIVSTLCSGMFGQRTHGIGSVIVIVALSTSIDTHKKNCPHNHRE